jgi:hypothetical protein
MSKSPFDPLDFSVTALGAAAALLPASAPAQYLHHRTSNVPWKPYEPRFSCIFYQNREQNWRVRTDLVVLPPPRNKGAYASPPPPPTLFHRFLHPVHGAALKRRRHRLPLHSHNCCPPTTHSAPRPTHQ